MPETFKLAWKLTPCVTVRGRARAELTLCGSIPSTKENREGLALLFLIQSLLQAAVWCLSKAVETSKGGEHIQQ